MNDQSVDLKGIKASIEKIEQHTLKLKASGAGIPAVEKNVRIILSIVENLKFGLVDPADVMDQ